MIRHTAALPDKYLARNLDDFDPPVLATKITNSPSGDSIQGRSDYISKTSRPPHVMPPSHTDQIYAPRWPTPVSTSVLVENLSIADPPCSNDTCRAFREGFADDERKTPLLGLISYGKWTVWFYSIWILLFTAIYVSHLLRDRLRRLKRSPGQLPSLNDKAIAFIRFWAYRRLNSHFTRKIGLRQISYGTLALLSISTVFFTILPWPEQPYIRTHFRFGSPPLSVRCAIIISALTPLTVALAGKVNVITWITGVGYAKLNVYHRYVSYLIFCLATVHVVSPLFFLPFRVALHWPHFFLACSLRWCVRLRNPTKSLHR
jgi:hypothetical protein